MLCYVLNLLPPAFQLLPHTKLGLSLKVQDVSLTKSEVRSQKFLTTTMRYRTKVVFETKIYRFARNQK